jgi:hypothetical protein
MAVVLSVASMVALWPASSAAEADPFIGTWVLNVAKSKYDPGPAPKDQTVTYEAVAEGLKITVKGTNGDGSALSTSYTGKLDGKDYPSTGAPSWDMQALKRVNANTIEITRKKGGKVVQTGTNVVSADGKTRTITVTGVDEQGRKINNVSVYDKK